MKAYNELWVNNRATNAKIKAWELEDVLKENEIVRLEDQFYSPNVYVWIGLFFFTSIAISFCSGLFLSLIGFSENSSVLGVVLSYEGGGDDCHPGIVSLASVGYSFNLLTVR